MKDKLIFITNDDGIGSPGLKAAAEAAAGLCDIVIAAPTGQQTAMSRALAGAKDEYFKEIEFIVQGERISAYHIDASPAMTVQHAYNVLFEKRKPDLIISGINYGENLGWDAFLSGTVGAAFQGASWGTPAMAVSLQTKIENHFHYGEVDWQGSKYFLRMLAEKLLAGDFDKRVRVWKTDIPADANQDTEWKFTRLADHHHFVARVENPTPKSKLGEMVVKVYDNNNNLTEGTDAHAIMKQNIVSVTPLTMDLTFEL